MAALSSVARGVPSLRARPGFSPRPVVAARNVVCNASKDEESKPAVNTAVARAAAAAIAAGLLVSAVHPEEAVAARSGGRVGASSFAARRSASVAPT